MASQLSRAELNTLRRLLHRFKDEFEMGADIHSGWSNVVETMRLVDGSLRIQKENPNVDRTKRQALGT